MTSEEHRQLTSALLQRQPGFIFDALMMHQCRHGVPPFAPCARGVKHAQTSLLDSEPASDASLTDLQTGQHCCSMPVMVDNPDFTPSQVGGLFTFLARQLAKPDNTLFVNRKLFDQVLEFLCRPDDDSRHTERQQVLLELLQVGGVVQFDEGRLLALAEKAKFFQICEFLYEKKHLFDKIIDCYLRDPLRKWEIFSYIHNLLSMPSYSPEEKQTVKDKALQHIQELMTLDPSKSADLVMVHFAEEVQQIISKLQDDQLLFKFLSCLLESREGHPSWTILPLERDLHELLLDLLCRFASQQLLSFLRTSQHYRLEEAIQLESL
eukprot:superscaffoldBa00002216_g13569